MDDDYERMRWNYRRAFIKSAGRFSAPPSNEDAGRGYDEGIGMVRVRPCSLVVVVIGKFATNGLLGTTS